MKITGGKAKGRSILLPSRIRGGLRPTASKVREAVFNILGNRIYGALFVDLFAGSGVMGLEALSRGASLVVFVENRHPFAYMIKESVSKMNFALQSKIEVSKAIDFLKKTKADHVLFDIIFLDPPYHTEDLDRIIDFLAEYNPVKEDGVILIEHFHKKELPIELSQSLRQKVYRYGDTVISLYKRKD